MINIKYPSWSEYVKNEKHITNQMFDLYLSKLASFYDMSFKQIKEDIVYLNMCFNMSTLSRANRLQVGEIIKTPNGTLIPGYNGTAPNTSNQCEYEDEITGKLVTYPHVICGFQNAIYKAAKDGISVVGSTGYSTDSPCIRCAPIILTVGIKRFVYSREYRLINHLTELKELGVQLIQIEPDVLTTYNEYYNQL